MKLFTSLIKKTLAESPKIAQAVRTVNDTAIDLGNLALDVYRLAATLTKLAELVYRHETILQALLQQNAVVNRESVNDLSMPNINKPTKNDKPN